MSHWPQHNRIKRSLPAILSIAAFLIVAYVVDNSPTWAAPVAQTPNQTVPPPTYLPSVVSQQISSCDSFLYVCNLTFEQEGVNGVHDWEPSGSAFVYSREREITASGLYSMTDTGHQLTFLVELEDIVEISYSPDGEQIAFVAMRASTQITDLYVYTVASQEVRMLSNPAQNDSSDFGPSWSPDSSMILFIRLLHDTDVADIYTIRPDGSELTRLTDTTTYENLAAFSPDGSQIVYVTQGAQLSTINLMAADGSNERNLSSAVAPNTDSPNWTADSKSIVFFGALSETDGDIYKVDTDGSNVVNLTDDELLQRNPVLSPDGSRILFIVARGNAETQSDFYTMNLDGSNVVKYQNSLARFGSLFDIQWHPNSELISFAVTSDSSNIYLLSVKQ